MELKEKTDQQLIETYTALHGSIYGMECFGSHDLLELDATGAELERRGYTIGQGYASPVITKGDEADGDEEG